MSGYDRVRREIDSEREAVLRALREHIDAGRRLALVKAPPGSGKTRLLVELAAHARRRLLRVAVGAQTNAQADDICRRLARECPGVVVGRFAARRSEPGELGGSVRIVTESRELLPGPCVVVATVAKWGTASLAAPFDFLLVDEAWQMAWKDLMLCGQVAPRFIMIGDPGQIPPVTTLSTERWETSPRPPHLPAPQVILRDRTIDVRPFELPATRRLPHDAAELVRSFYDFAFRSYAGPGERSVETTKGGRSTVDQAMDLLEAGSVAAITARTRRSGPPVELDEDIAALAVFFAQRVLDRGAVFRNGNESRALAAADIGLVATHRVMVTAMELGLPDDLRGQVKVDTPERWQGLERPLMIVVHPLSGVTDPSDFDLETGRLCVMASRHLGGLVVVTRDHLRSTLEAFVPRASQPLGREDVVGRGHAQHLQFWTALESAGRVVAT